MGDRTYQMDIDGIAITVIKKHIKNMYLRVKKEDGSVLISAPLRMSDDCIRAFAKEREGWIRKYRQKYEKADGKRKETPALSKAELEEQKRFLKREAESLVKKWEPVMGVSVSGVTIRQMKTRWGSCNVKSHHINLNLALLKKPPECLEYVVVHEMTHILEAGHNAVFWGYMTKFYPAWKQVRSYLRNEEAR